MFKEFLFLFTLIFCLSRAHAEPPIIWNVPQEADNVIERTDFLELIQDELNQSPQAKIALVGISGVGKSELTKSLLNQLHESYSVVWWFDAQQDLVTQFYELAKQWNHTVTKGKDDIPLQTLSPTGVVSYVLNLLRTTDLEWLIVYDNAKSYEALELFLPMLHQSDQGNKHIIFTSQDKRGWPKSVPISVFTETEATAFIAQNQPNSEDSTNRELIKEIGKLPFYLGHAMLYIKKHKISVSDYLEKYRNQSHQGESMSKHQHQIKEIQSKNPQAFELLGLLSLTDETLFTHALLDDYFRNRFPDLDILETMNALDEYSLVNPHITPALKTRRYSVHEITRQEVLNILSDSQISDLIQNLSDTFVNLLDMQWEEMVKFFIANPESVAQAQAVWNLGIKENIQNASLLKLGLVLMEYHIYKSRNHKAYEALFKQILNIIGNKSLQGEKTLIDRFYVNSVYVRDLYQDAKLTERVAIKLTELTQKIDVDNPDSSLRLFYNHAQFHLFQGDIEKCLELLNQAAPLLQRAQSNSNINLYWYIKAWAHLEGAQYVETQAALDHFFETFVEEQNHVLKLYGMNMRAHACLESGKLSEAIKWCDKSLVGAKEYFQSEDSEITAEAMLVKARAFIEGQRYEEAEETLLKCEQIYNAYFGGAGRHADQALVLTMIGEVYEAKGEFDKALNQFIKAREIYDTLYGKNQNNIDDVSKLIIGIAKLGLHMKREDLVQTYFKLHIDNFGSTHKRSIELLDLILKSKVA